MSICFCKRVGREPRQRTRDNSLHEMLPRRFFTELCPTCICSILHRCYNHVNLSKSEVYSFTKHKTVMLRLYTDVVIDHAMGFLSHVSCSAGNKSSSTISLRIAGTLNLNDDTTQDVGSNNLKDRRQTDKASTKNVEDKTQT